MWMNSKLSKAISVFIRLSKKETREENENKKDFS